MWNHSHLIVHSVSPPRSSPCDELCITGRAAFSFSFLHGFENTGLAQLARNLFPFMEIVFQCLNRMMLSRVCVGVLCARLCLTLCNHMDCRSPGSSIRGSLQVRILEQVVIPKPGHLPNPGIKHVSLASPTLAGRFFTTPPPDIVTQISKTNKQSLSNCKIYFYLKIDALYLTKGWCYPRSQLRKCPA